MGNGIEVKMAEEHICWRSAEGIADAEAVDHAVRQEFSGRPDVIEAWEQACADGNGPDGPVGADGWVWVRLPD